MLIIMIVTHLNIFQHGDGIIGERCEAEIFGEQIGSHTKFVESHQTSRQRGGNLARDATLMQADDTLVLFAHTHEDDLCGANATASQVLSLYLYLVGWYQWNTAPQDDLRAKEIGGHRGYAAPCALTLEGGDGTRMGNEEGRLFPYQRQQFVKVVGSRRAIARGDAVGRIDCCQQTEVLVVDEFPLLAFLDALDGEPEFSSNWL